MAKHNAFLERIKREKEQACLETQQFTRQLMVDLISIALNTELGIGAERLEQINLKLAALFDEYAVIWKEDTIDTEYSRSTLDAKLKQIYGDRFMPWEERYG